MKVIFLLTLFLASCSQPPLLHARQPASDDLIIQVDDEEKGPQAPASAEVTTSEPAAVVESEAPPPIKIHSRPQSAIKARIKSNSEDYWCGDYKNMLKHNGVARVAETEFDKLNQEQILKSAYYRGRIVIHHTAGNKTDTAASIINYHIKDVSQGGRGWTDAGYHYLIDFAGNVHEGRPLDKVGAHVHNVDDKKAKSCNQGDAYPIALDKDYQAIGISLLGNFDLYSPSIAQQASLKKLVSYLKQKYVITEVQPHRHYKQKSCPGKYADKLFSVLYQLDDKSESPMASVGKNPFMGTQLQCKFCSDYKGKKFKVDL